MSSSASSEPKQVHVKAPDFKTMSDEDKQAWGQAFAKALFERNGIEDTDGQ